VGSGDKPDLRLGGAEDGEGVGLRLEPRWRIVPVPHPLRVVHADHRRLRLDLDRHRKTVREWSEIAGRH
jgi:hypothetical protein